MALAGALVVNVVLVILLTPLGFETRPATDLKTVGYIAIGTIFTGLFLDVASLAALLFRRARLASGLAIVGSVLFFFPVVGDRTGSFFSVPIPPVIDTLECDLPGRAPRDSLRSLEGLPERVVHLQVNEFSDVHAVDRHRAGDLGHARTPAATLRADAQVAHSSRLTAPRRESLNDHAACPSCLRRSRMAAEATRWACSSTGRRSSRDRRQAVARWSSASRDGVRRRRGSVPRCRIYTPTRETAFAGHPAGRSGMASARGWSARPRCCARRSATSPSATKAIERGFVPNPRGCRAPFERRTARFCRRQVEAHRERQAMGLPWLYSGPGRTSRRGGFGRAPSRPTSVCSRMRPRRRLGLHGRAPAQAVGHPAGSRVRDPCATAPDGTIEIGGRTELVETREYASDR